MRVATFNVRNSRGRDGRNRWLFRRRACFDAIRGFDADVVGLQEVRPRQLRQLRRAFPDHAVLGRGRNADGRGEHAAVLVRPGWTVESSETRWLSPTPDVPGSLGWDAEITRVATLVRLRRGTTTLGVVNTHLDSEGRTARACSAELIVSWLDPGRPWLVLGDLNDLPGSATLRVFIDAGLVDSLPPDAGGTEHGFTGAHDRKRIDYVLTGPGVRATSAWIGHDRPHGRLPSDHWPVLAEVAIG